ncbi:unnamed protein product [Arabidopsis halleri]
MKRRLKGMEEEVAQDASKSRKRKGSYSSGIEKLIIMVLNSSLFTLFQATNYCRNLCIVSIF